MGGLEVALGHHSPPHATRELAEAAVGRPHPSLSERLGLDLDDHPVRPPGQRARVVAVPGGSERRLLVGAGPPVHVAGGGVRERPLFLRTHTHTRAHTH
jgi:hypothetical protein